MYWILLAIIVWLLSQEVRIDRLTKRLQALLRP